jgi:Holliday junction resolvasome RuvABC DNA-binding subunit
LEGGGNHADNLIVLCGAHHRAGHRGELEITGSVATGVRFQHADGNGYGHSVEARAVQIQVKVFATLRRLGFREAETRQALAQLGTMRKPGDATFECVLREALAKLTTPAH